MYIEVLSAAEAKLKVPKVKHIAISIATSENISLPKNDNRIAELFLLFDDVDTNKYSDAELMSLYSQHKVQLFTNEMAKEVLKFVISHPCGVLLVNCEAGISRSAGVAAAIGKVFNGDDTFVFNSRKYMPNMLVYSKIIMQADRMGLLK